MRNGRRRSRCRRPVSPILRRTGRKTDRQQAAPEPLSLQQLDGDPRRMGHEVVHCLQLGRIGFAGPFVHEEFLELERDGAALARVAVMDEPSLLALALEGDIFADVERARPLKSNRRISSIKGSSRNAHSSRGMENVPMLMSGASS